MIVVYTVFRKTMLTTFRCRQIRIFLLVLKAVSRSDDHERGLQQPASEHGLCKNKETEK